MIRSDAHRDAPMERRRILGDFIVGDVLGEGGFGMVFRAEQRTLGRPAVIKILRGSSVAQPDALERFTLEARLAARFDHPYAAHIYAFGAEADGTAWLAMELVNGTPLDDMLDRSGPIAVERFVPLLERLCDVVQSAHDQGIVHRDIKPSNVMVISRAGRLMPKLLDFGIAKVISAQLGDPPATLHVRPSGGYPSDAATAPLDATPPLDQTVQAHANGAASAGSLTRVGQLVGTPAYMAPEQWLAGQHVGPWSDQYAIGMLAYEALVGQRPFLGASLADIAEEHLYAPLPPLPPHLPVAVHAVLARATAKDPSQRFANLLELSAAFRAAVLGEDATNTDLDALEVLSPERRAAWSADAPQPIAEAVAALAGARSATRIAERTNTVVGLLARWIGVTAIACRSHATRLGTTTTEARDLLKALRRRPLHDTEWLDLATELAQPVAAAPELWPVPELAAFLTGHSVAALRALVRADASGDALDDAARRAAVAARVAQLDGVLAELDWLLAYDLARDIPGGTELWMGPRSHERTSRRSAVAVGTGDVVLLDADGARVLGLSPLVQISAPTPGQAEEVFVFTGPARVGDGARLCAYPRGFERDVADVWDWLGEQLIAAVPDLPVLDDARPPYPGLAAFTAEDRESFVGREREVEELLNRLRQQPVVVVSGASGVGKSSFIAAGLVPALPPSWRAESVRPGEAPLAALQAISDRSNTPYRDRLRDRRVLGVDDVAAGLVGSAEREGGVLVIVVDQAEELFTLCDEADRDAFARVVAAASSSSHLRFVIGVRDDFLCRIEALPGWRGLLGRGVQVLLVPTRAELERVLTVPVARRGYKLEDGHLASEIVAAVADHPGALPLLAFAAAELWDRRDHEARRITRAAYLAIGGVSGALVQHADAVVDRMPGADRRLVRHAFRRLVTPEGTRAPIGRAELVTALGGTREAAAVVERLIAARLVTSREDDDGGERVELAHECLVTAWPRLADWRREDDASARFIDRLGAGARHWNERGRPGGLLWRGEALSDLRRWRDADLSLAPLEAAFADATLRAAKKQRRRLAATIAAAFAVLAMGVVALTWANRRIDGQRTAAVDRLAQGFVERARLALVDGDGARATLFLGEAVRLGAGGPRVDVMASAAARPLAATDGVLAQVRAQDLVGIDDAVVSVDEDQVLSMWTRTSGLRTLAQGVETAVPSGDLVIALRSDGALTGFDRAGAVRWHVLDADRVELGITYDVVASRPAERAVTLGTRAILWSSTDGRAIASLPDDHVIRAAAFDPLGGYLATADDSGVVRFWRASDGVAVSLCRAGGEAAAIAFTRAGDAAAVATMGGDIVVCEREAGTVVGRLVGHRARVRAIDVASDGTLLTASDDGTARTWNVASGEPLGLFAGHRGRVLAAHFAPDGKTLLTASADGTARIWSREGLELGRFEGHATRLLDAMWEPDGAHVITMGFDGTIRAWDVPRALAASTVRDHAREITQLHVSTDDRWVLTGGDDGLVVVRDRHSSEVIAKLHHGTAIRAMAVAPDSTTLVSVDDSGVARIWKLPGGAPTLLAAEQVSVAVYVGDAIVATDGDDAALHLWRVDGTPLATIPMGFDPGLISVDPQRRYLVAAEFWAGPTARVVNVATHEVIATLDHGSDIGNVIIDGELVVTADMSAMSFWRLDGTRVARSETSRLADAWILPDHRILTAHDDGKVLVWDRGGTLRSTLETGGAAAWGYGASPDGTVFATAGVDGSTRVWDTATLMNVLTLRPSGRRLSSAAFTRDGNALVTAGVDGIVTTWDMRREVVTPELLAERVRCRVPWRLDGDQVMPRELDLDDPTCADVR